MPRAVTGPWCRCSASTPRLWRPAGANRRAFLVGCLRALDESIGGRLVVRTGDPGVVVPALAAEVGAKDVFVTG